MIREDSEGGITCVSLLLCILYIICDFYIASWQKSRNTEPFTSPIALRARCVLASQTLTSPRRSVGISERWNIERDMRLVKRRKFYTKFINSWGHTPLPPSRELQSKGRRDSGARSCATVLAAQRRAHKKQKRMCALFIGCGRLARESRLSLLPDCVTRGHFPYPPVFVDGAGVYHPLITPLRFFPYG